MSWILNFEDKSKFLFRSIFMILWKLPDLFNERQNDTHPINMPPGEHTHLCGCFNEPFEEIFRSFPRTEFMRIIEDWLDKFSPVFLCARQCWPLLTWCIFPYGKIVRSILTSGGFLGLWKVVQENSVWNIHTKGVSEIDVHNINTKTNCSIVQANNCIGFATL